MIRINLLAVDRERAKRRASLQFAEKVTIACTLILVVTGIGIGWWYWSLVKQASSLNAEIAIAESEANRLKTQLKLVSDVEKRKQALEARVALIDQLRQNQSGAVHLLDEVSRAVPDGLWLTDMQQKGSEVTIGGRCAALTALSDFVTNLEASKYFKKPVEIVNSQTEKASSTPIDLVKFTVKAVYAPPGAAATPPAGNAVSRASSPR